MEPEPRNRVPIAGEQISIRRGSSAGVPLLLLMTLRSILALLLLGLGGCTSVFYQPSRRTFFEPSEKVGVQPAEIWFSSDDRTKLHGWYFRARDRNARTGLVVQFHGNAENMTSHFLSLLWVVEHGYDFFTFDYRGYGKSEGKPFPTGVHNDAVTALLKAKGLAAERSIPLIIYGQSLGGAVALRAFDAVKDQLDVKAVVVESSFLSYKRIAVDKLKDYWLTWPLQWLGYVLVSNRYGPKKAIQKRPPVPLLVLHGELDGVVPIKHGRQIFDAAAPPKCFWKISTRAHAHMMNIAGGKYRQPLLNFLEHGQCPE
jgi:hypothetical protein